MPIIMKGIELTGKFVKKTSTCAHTGCGEQDRILVWIDQMNQFRQGRSLGS
jgi:hypothetical protein